MRDTSSRCKHSEAKSNGRTLITFGGRAAGRSRSRQRGVVAPLKLLDFLRATSAALLGEPHAGVRFGHSFALTVNRSCRSSSSTTDPSGLRLAELNRRYGAPADRRLDHSGATIESGIDLGRRMGTPQLTVLTAPLLPTSSVRQEGKTANGRGVAERRPAVAIRILGSYGATTEDADVGRFLDCSPSRRRRDRSLEALEGRRPQ